MSIKEAQKPAREFRPLFDRAMKLIQQRYPDWIEASRQTAVLANKKSASTLDLRLACHKDAG
jgi:hypothetical protein